MLDIFQSYILSSFLRSMRLSLPIAVRLILSTLSFPALLLMLFEMVCQYTSSIYINMYICYVLSEINSHQRFFKTCNNVGWLHSNRMPGHHCNLVLQSAASQWFTLTFNFGQNSLKRLCFDHTWFDTSMTCTRKFSSLISYKAFRKAVTNTCDRGFWMKPSYCIGPKYFWLRFKTR